MGYIVDRSYTRAEMETTIVWDDEGKIAEIYTASPITMRKLDKLCVECPDTYIRTWTENNADGRITAAKYTVPCNLIKFAKPIILTKEQREKKRAVMLRMNAEKTV